MSVAIVKVACVRICARKKVILLRVKIGSKIYDSKDEPIMLVLNPLDKENISNMDKDHLKYCSFPRGKHSQEEIKEFMNLKEGDSKKVKEPLNQLQKKIDFYKSKDLIKTKDISDGYHTFGDLYHHRAILFSMVCNLLKDKSWKSKLHDDGTMFDDNMFIVGVETPEGHYTYHYKMEYWDIFNVKELEYAPKWDGHKPEDITRLFSLLKEGEING